MARKGQIIDLSGKKFDRLEVLELDPIRANDGNTRWKCVCDCGKTITVDRMSLVNEHTKSCGCLREDKCSVMNKRHGLSHHKLYKVWEAMRRRCKSPAEEAYKYYGGRGIEVCSDWGKFECFYEWALSNGYREGLTIERLNNDGNYEASNCTWIPRVEQPKNRRPFKRRTREELRKDGYFDKIVKS